ncbi:uncharacterized protein E6C27_scaffold134G00630 [Cucumis melo var. makuwa]|uniref:Uncharacterized protein n=1 Tax=Cucumis melo var. makuwa TaxID=1194695 RepID=A0A5A7SNV1_CUCMM|nr:uncharacterized protein E6C27_scaffold134G00630 [Cucumis melo var. makuwa]
MDCWSLSLPLDDEFKKLVNRMNPHSAEFRRKLSAVISPFVASASSRKPLQSSDTNTSTSSFCAITGNKSSYPSSTLLEVDSANKRGSLLEVVQAVLVHPDKNMGSPLASESFKKLQCAYESLVVGSLYCNLPVQGSLALAFLMEQ